VLHLPCYNHAARSRPAQAKLIEQPNRFGEPKSDIPHFRDYALTGDAADTSKSMRMT
jgi:hypothetical protein